jgi:hypothetical protein
MLSQPRLIALVASVTFLVGCGSSVDVTAPVSVAAGTYLMTSVNGMPLPANVSDEQSPVWINSGSLTLELSGKFTSAVTYQRFVDGSSVTISDSCSGTYKRSSKGLDFYELGTCKGVYSATVEGQIVTAQMGPALKVEYRM